MAPGQVVTAQQQMLTVGQVREALNGLPDDAMIAVTSGLPDGMDRGVTTVLRTDDLIPWSHDCTDAPPEHRPGRDCPTVVGVELWLASTDELADQ